MPQGHQRGHLANLFLVQDDSDRSVVKRRVLGLESLSVADARLSSLGIAKGGVQNRLSLAEQYVLALTKLIKSSRTTRLIC